MSTTPAAGYNPLAPSQIRRELDDLRMGRIQPVGKVELAGTGTTTTVPTRSCNTGSVVILTPISANAAAAIATGGVWYEPRTGEFIIHHTNFGSGRVFHWAILSPIVRAG